MSAPTAMRWSRVSPGFYTSPGGWSIMYDPADATPDRPWVLRLHGNDEARVHTLNIAKLLAAQPARLARWKLEDRSTR